MTQPPAASATSEVVAVALPVPVDALFHYRARGSQAESARVGCRVLVPFGRRRLTGVVVARRATSPREKLRAIERVLDAEPVLSPELLDILREAAWDALCPLGLAVAAALPAGSAPRTAVRLELTRLGHEALARGALRGSARALCERLAARPAGARALRRRHPQAPELIRGLLRDGVIARTAAPTTRAAREASERVAAAAPGIDAERAAQTTLARAPGQAALLRRLAACGPLATRELAREDPGASARLRALAARGLVAISQRPRPSDVLGEPLETPHAVVLTPEQEAALGPVTRAVRERRFASFLLHGVTGSGKTEIYLGAVGEARRGGRQALVLVPEITLTHQIVARLRARFGDALAVLHSGLRPSERWEQWQRLRRGEALIAVGARSALFAPLSDLGVVVIDEEHDAAYKNEEGFRYHARDLAARRARAASCPLLLGSATPSVETRFAADRGELQRIVLPHRIGGRPLPAVEIVDLERERAAAPRGRKLILTRPLRAALTQTLADGGQALLLLNRRGFSTKIFCFDCGHAERCKHCDISLVYHATEQRLRCHYCDFQIPPPQVCSGCGRADTALLGIGTERLEEEVRTLFPNARIARLDRDTAARRGAAGRLLRDLHARRIDVVVGTQLLAKGHDMPGVRLVGVVLADLGLHLPDFRAAERTFQLLTQVAGRAGRGAEPGRVVVQTFVPDHYAVRPVREHDYESFYAEELGHRAPLGYPPFGRLVQAMVSGPERAAAEDAARGLAEVARAAASGAEGLEVLGPAPAPLPRLRDRYRFQVLLKGPDGALLRAAARELAHAAARLPAPVRARVDADPINML